MAKIREIRRRIRSVTNISQVTKAMQMVAASKMRRAQEQVSATRPYAAKSWEVLQHLAAQQTVQKGVHPLLARRQVKTIGVVVITGDKGLCGGYNTNVLRTALDYFKQVSQPVKVVTVGRKGRDALSRFGFNIIAEFTDVPAQPSLLDVTPIARTVIDDYLLGDYDEVELIYTDFINVLNQRPTIRKLLPITFAQVDSLVMQDYVTPFEEETAISEFIYEPSEEILLNTLLPRFTEMQIYQAILESFASEQSARMVAMRNATENAHDLIHELTLTYNRARQEAITNEMLDIAGGAEALVAAGS